jgi:exosome complex component CSL4
MAASDVCLPGQPIPLAAAARGPAPALGPGTYARDGVVRASLVGVPRYDGAVRAPTPLRAARPLTASPAQ